MIENDVHPREIKDIGIRHFVYDLPGIRIVKIQADGTLIGSAEYPAHYFGGTVPNAGDTIGMIWGDGDYELQAVQRRYFLNEWKGRGPYWVIVVRDADQSPQADAICTHALLMTDLAQAIEDKKPPKEILARMRQLDGEPAPGTRRYKPKARKPDPGPEDG
jgi:hypothetical protein